MGLVDGRAEGLCPYHFKLVRGLIAPSHRRPISDRAAVLSNERMEWALTLAAMGASSEIIRRTVQGH